MTFLELARKLALESGTVSGEGKPATVIGATDREGRCVGWVRDAWRMIQIGRTDWKWMKRSFSGDTVAGQSAYAPADLGATRHAAWEPGSITVGEAGGTTFVDYQPWSQMRVTMMAGVAPGRPVAWSVNLQGQLVLYPAPDRVFTLGGEYRVAPQELASDADVPEMPAQFHDLIWMTALVTLALYDEGAFQSQAWEAMRRRLHMRLVADQAPAVYA